MVRKNPEDDTIYMRNYMRRRMQKDRKAYNAYCRKYQKRYHDRLRRESLEKLGGKCVRCGFDDPRALQIDHIHGKGRKPGKKMNFNQERRFIIDDKNAIEVAETFQLLCANCNWIKRFENKEHSYSSRAYI